MVGALKDFWCFYRRQLVHFITPTGVKALRFVSELLKMHSQEVGVVIPAIRPFSSQTSRWRVASSVDVWSGCSAADRFGLPTRPAFRFPAAHRFDRRANSLHKYAENMTPSGREFGAELVAAPPAAGPPSQRRPKRVQASVLYGTNRLPNNAWFCLD